MLDKVGAVEEVPADRWAAGNYFDADRHAPDKINSKWGGFIPDTAFDPTRFGIPPSLGSVDRSCPASGPARGGDGVDGCRACEDGA